MSIFIEVVAIGNEILSGATINTNASCIGRHLGKEGWGVSRQTTLSDDFELLKRGLSESLARADVIIATGGLGPTLDDITHLAARELFQIEPLTIENSVGSAPGFFYNEKKKILILLPGVPLEMETMLQQSVILLLKEKLPFPRKFFQEEFHLCGLNENKVDPLLRELQAFDPEMQLGIYPGYGILTVRVISSNIKSLEHAKTKILQTFKKNFFSAKNGTIQEAVHTWFMENNKTLAFAESCTGGLLSTHITALPGASFYFLGSLIVYSNELKEKLLGVLPQTLSSEGAVSIQTVKEMLTGLFQGTSADFGIAVSGIAGPTGGTSDKPVGTVFYALGKRGSKIDFGSFCAKGNRQMVMLYTANTLLGKLLQYVIENE